MDYEPTFICPARETAQVEERPTGAPLLAHQLCKKLHGEFASPLTTGVFVAEGLSVHYESDARSSISLYDENNINITRSVSVPDLLGETSPQDNGGKEEEEEGGVSWRDMGSQDDVRDVQMDNSNTATPCNNEMDPTNVQHLPSSSWDVANPSKTKRDYLVLAGRKEKRRRSTLGRTYKRQKQRPQFASLR